MSDFDNTNRGALFTVNDAMTITAQGKVNIAGGDHSAILVNQTISRDGRKAQVLYIKAAVMWTNEDKTNENAPDYGGDLETHSGKRVAAWKRTSESGNKYLSVAVSDKWRGQEGEGNQPQTNQSPSPGNYNPPDDEIPF